MLAIFLKTTRQGKCESYEGFIEAELPRQKLFRETCMRFLIIDTDYPSFLHWLYTQDPSLKHQAYEKQMQARAESFFACGLSYSSNLRKLGHEAYHIFFNNEALQAAWAREHG